ncbi:hypothetical protein LPJ75_004024 [Coemansia sp. RSA 2598]|nr:hypothetical protein LPJ75_004024 [Coemansia sp. RSA 2598]
MRKEKTYLMKALLRYTLFPAAFSATSVFLENHNALIAEKPRFLPPDFSDAEIWIAVIIGRHGSIIAEELNICIVSAASTFIQDSKTRGYCLVDAHTINEEMPLWLRASVLSDILDLDMGVPKCMAAEIEASKEVYEKIHKKSAPLVLPEPIFAPTRTKPQDAIANKSSSRLDPKLIDELVMVVTDYPVSEEKNMYIQNFLDSYFAEIPKGNDSDQSAL